MLYYLYFISDILVVSYVLSCAEPAESGSNSAYSAGAVAAPRQNGVTVPQKASARGWVGCIRPKHRQQVACEVCAERNRRC